MLRGNINPAHPNTIGCIDSMCDVTEVTRGKKMQVIFLGWVAIGLKSAGGTLISALSHSSIIHQRTLLCIAEIVIVTSKVCNAGDLKLEKTAQDDVYLFVYAFLILLLSFELHRRICPLTDLVQFPQTKPSYITKSASLITGTELGNLLHAVIVHRW